MGVVGKHIKEVAGATYTTITLPASEAVDVAPALLGMFGADIFMLILNTDEKDRAAMLANPKVLGPIINSVLKALLTGDAPSETIKRLLKQTKCDKCRIGDTALEGTLADEATFDRHFAGHLGELAQVVFWVAQVNFFGL